MSDWISVTDGLPEDEEWVLVYSNEPEYEGDFENGYFYVAAIYSQSEWATANEILHMVTHWMPLPEPPKP